MAKRASFNPSGSARVLAIVSFVERGPAKLWLGPGLRDPGGVMAATDWLQALRPRLVGRETDYLTPRLAFIGLFLCLGAVLVAASGAPSDAELGGGLLELLIVGAKIAAGVYAL